MRKGLLTIFCFLLTVCLYAGQISKEQAHEAARAFLAKRGITMTSDATPAFKAKRKAATSGDAGYYIFNAGDDRGYVIVSGDDRTEQILGYTDSGAFDPATAPEGMMAWLNGYVDFIDRLDRENVTAKVSDRTDAPARAQAAKHAIKPLVTCKWNQGDPYNLLCPKYYNADGTLGDRSATGCVATALAQVMYYYKWPDALVKSIPRHSFDSNGHQISLPGIAKGTKIDWANMTDIYDGLSTDVQKNAVAELMLYVGQSVKMGYGPSSGAGFNGGQPLVEYFGYDDGTHSEFRNNYTLSEWMDLIYNEIASGHPVAFAGTATGGAHAFVVDGYDGDGLFHLNWGWGGGSDGYFRIEILNPGDNSGIGASSSSDGYSMGQEALILRLPDDVEADDKAMMTINDTEIRGNEIFSNYINWTGETNSFDYGIGYVEEDGSLVSIGNTNRADNLGANYFYGASFGISGLAAGTYKVVPISKTTKSSVWKTSFNIKERYIIADVKADGSYTLQMYNRPVDLEVESIRFTGNKVVNNTQKLDVVFKNNTDEFYGEIYLFASKTDNKGGQASRSAVSLKKGYTTTITFFFNPTETGKYNIWLTYDPDGNNVVPGGQTTVDITATASPEERDLQVTSVTFENISSGTIYGNFISGKVRVTNNSEEDFDGAINVGIWKGEIGENMFWGAGNDIVPVYVEAGKKAVVSFSFDNLEYDKQYGFNFAYSTGGELSGGGLGHVNKLARGIVTYDSEGGRSAYSPSSIFTVPAKVVAVDARGITSLTKVYTTSSPNALYFFDEGAIIPDGLDMSKVVVGGHIDEISLTDESPFYSPIDFTAGRISYSRPIYRAGKESSWEAIALPFSPQSVKVDGRRLAYDGSDGLSVMEFNMTGDDNNVYFSKVADMQKNVPYLYSVTDDSFVDKIIVFEAEDALVPATGSADIVAGTDSYSYHGTTVSLTGNNYYVLNTEGTAFTLKKGATIVNPYRSYFVSKLPDELMADEIPVRVVVTGIDGVTDNSVADGQADVYSLDGVKVGTAVMESGRVVMPALPKGIYVVGGRKVVVR